MMAVSKSASWGIVGFYVYSYLRAVSRPKLTLRYQGDSPWFKPYASIDWKKKKKSTIQYLLRQCTFAQYLVYEPSRDFD